MLSEPPDEAVEELAAKRYGRATKRVWASLDPESQRIWLSEARRDLQGLWPLVARYARADAAADEQQRIVEQIGDMCTYRERDGSALPHPHPADHLGPCPYGQAVQRIVAADSVPIADRA